MKSVYKKYFLPFSILTLISFIIAFIIPFVLGIMLSFQSWKGTFLNAKFVGISNYIEAFLDKEFINAFIFTFKFAIVSVITINAFAFAIALLLTRGKRGTNFFRTLFFMPNLIGGIILGYIWQVIINALLYRFDLSLSSNPNYGFWGLVIVMNWQLIGYMSLIYIAAIQNISSELIDASLVDGANAWERFKHITVPSVMPALTICLFLTITNSFKLYDQNLALTGGGPNYQTQMLALNIVNTIYNQVKPGLGQAKAVLFFVVIGIISLVQVFLTRRKEIDA